MSIPGFVVRNALRNKRRFFLTVLSVSLSLFLFTTLQTALRELTQPPTTEDAAVRIVVRNKVSLGNVLPAKYAARLERTPGIKHVMKLTWFGGIYKDKANFFPQFAVDADQLFNVFTEAEIDPKQREDFLKEKNACVVGIQTMQRFGWKIGDRITLQGTMWPCDPELIIRGVYYKGIDKTNLFFHNDYFDELMGNKGLVGTYWVVADNTEVIPDLINRIDKMFANSDAETKTESERAFQLSFVSMFGNIKVLIGSISTVIVFTMILVTASTMSMAIRERSREIAILKTIGFDGWQIFGLILAESFGLSMLGGMIGCLGPRLLFPRIDIYSLSHGVLLKLDVTTGILAAGLSLAALLGIISCLVPAYTSIRTTVTAGLRELD